MHATAIPAWTEPEDKADADKAVNDKTAGSKYAGSGPSRRCPPATEGGSGRHRRIQSFALVATDQPVHPEQVRFNLRQHLPESEALFQG